jgi:hypothetical protein
MAPKNVFITVIFASLLTATGASAVEQYRAGEFLGLDLSKAALSPKPLGPVSKFEPVPVQAKADQRSDNAQARVEPKAGPNVVVRKTRIAHIGAAKPRGAARTKLARQHTNPLDAQAFDTRVQVWPCRSGGICGWKRERN